MEALDRQIRTTPYLGQLTTFIREVAYTKVESDGEALAIMSQILAQVLANRQFNPQVRTLLQSLIKDKNSSRLFKQVAKTQLKGTNGTFL